MEIKRVICTKFIPSYYRRDTFLKLQRLQQGSTCVNDYAKMMESLLLKVWLQFESEEEKVARFVTGFWREKPYVIELYEYSSLEKVLQLTIKVETQLKKKNKAKRSSSYNDYYTNSWKGKERKHDKNPSKSPQDPPTRSNMSKNS